MLRSSPLRHALLARLLRAASVPAALVASGAALGGCASSETRCFEPQGDSCPSREDATPLIPRACDESLLSVDSDAEREGSECCYEVTLEQLDGCAVEGRPLLCDGEAVLASPRERSDWVGERAKPSLVGLDADERHALAQMWTRAALFEHASVASFSRFALQLMAVGAPPSLLEEAHRAALDEVRHAAEAFTLAAAYRGAPVGPSRLPLPEALPVKGSLEHLAASTVVEACINETLAVLVAIEQLTRAGDPVVRDVLERLIEDESRHAALAWCTVKWAIRSGGPQVRAAVAAAVDAARSELEAPHPELFSTERVRSLERHGLLDAGARAEAMRRGYDEIITPCIRALLDVRPAPLELLSV